MKWKELIAVAVLFVGGAIAGASLFPTKVQSPPPPPRIVTVWDTVVQLDTVWRTELRERIKTDTLNLIETVTVTEADTIYQCPDVIGLTALSVPQTIGDSTLMAGFSLHPLPNGLVERRDWETQAYTMGPLRGIILNDTLPPLVAYWPVPPTPKPCGFLCKAKLFGVGALTGVAGCAVIAR